MNIFSFKKKKKKKKKIKIKIKIKIKKFELLVPQKLILIPSKSRIAQAHRSIFLVSPFLQKISSRRFSAIGPKACQVGGVLSWFQWRVSWQHLPDQREAARKHLHFPTFLGPR
jgi:hypothetical protein